MPRGQAIPGLMTSLLEFARAALLMMVPCAEDNCPQQQAVI
ncbi:hypothetical protein [Ktedonosporobacter rubrisoli]|nr:hypothetical protein [Ktedonosporobacter rubrisoli]